MVKINEKHETESTSRMSFMALMLKEDNFGRILTD